MENISKGGKTDRKVPFPEKNESARRRLMEIIDEAEKTKKVYPSLNLDKEFENPVFRRLLSAGVPVISAYELIHRDEVNSLLIEKAVRQAEKRIASAVSSGTRVPDENGSRPSAASVSTVDPRNLTKAERKSIREKVRRGESVYL